VSIRSLALEIYQLEKELDKLRKVQAAAAPGELQVLSWEISQVKKRRDELRSLLESRKEKNFKI